MIPPGKHKGLRVDGECAEVEARKEDRSVMRALGLLVGKQA